MLKPVSDKRCVKLAGQPVLPDIHAKKPSQAELKQDRKKYNAGEYQCDHYYVGIENPHI